MPGISGLDVLERVVDFDPAIDVVLMTAHYTSESAVEAIRKGASDYLNKPVSIAALRERVNRLIGDAQRRQRGQRARKRKCLLPTHALRTWWGAVRRWWKCFFAYPAGRTPFPHRSGHRRNRHRQGTYRQGAAQSQPGIGWPRLPVPLNCSAVVESLFESELFGHIRGSFTGATQANMGLFEYADRGTIFLDEIGDMPLGAQAKLLRTLQNQEVLRVGSLTPRRVDVRVIAATHRDLRAAIADKLFREDLYYRLSMVEVHVPPLADRQQDLPLLIRFFIERFATQFRKDIRGLTQRAHIVLARHGFPGNSIRELENVLGRCPA